MRAKGIKFYLKSYIAIYPFFSVYIYAREIKLIHRDVSNQKKSRKMDVFLGNKRLVLVAILLLCFLSIPATARSLRREISKGAEEGKRDNFKPKEKRETNGEDLITMDYTPARKKTPVHN